MWTFSKGLCILRSVTRIMVKTYNCSCNRNMYLWWCSNVYKRLQSFIWRYFYCTFLGFLAICSNVQPGVGKFDWIWLEWFARGQGIWLQIFEKSQIPTPCSASPPPPPPRRHYIDRWINISDHSWGIDAPVRMSRYGTIAAVANVLELTVSYSITIWKLCIRTVSHCLCTQVTYSMCAMRELALWRLLRCVSV